MKKFLLILLMLGLWTGAKAQKTVSKAERLAPATFAKLGTPNDGDVRYCSDCAATAPCTGSGTGADAYRVAGAWNCNTGAGGSGTVTSVSVAPANGISGTVANPTTTPAITLDIAALDATKIGGGLVSSTEFGYLDGVTSSIQTQLNGKQATLSLPLSTANGGFGADVSAQTGFAYDTAGVFSFIGSTGSNNVVLSTGPTVTGLVADNTSQLADYDVAALPGTCTSGKRLHRDGTGAYESWWGCLKAGNSLAQFFDSSNSITATHFFTINLNASASPPASISNNSFTAIAADGNVARFEAKSFGAIASFTGSVYGGTAASPTAVTSGTQLTGVNAYAYDGTVLRGPIASFRTYAAENITATANGSKACISTVALTTTTLTDSLCQQNDGGITVGAPTGGSKGAGTLNVAANLYVNGTVVSAGGTTINATNGVIPYRSDASTFLDSPFSVSSGTVTATKNALGVTAADGLLLTNTTAAAVGAQQFSPSFEQCGDGWKTTATAARQQVCWRTEVQPLQNTTNPGSKLVFSDSVNGGAYTAQFTLFRDLTTAGAGPLTFYDAASSTGNQSLKLTSTVDVNPNNSSAITFRVRGQTSSNLINTDTAASNGDSIAFGVVAVNSPTLPFARFKSILAARPTLAVDEITSQTGDVFLARDPSLNTLFNINSNGLEGHQGTLVTTGTTGAQTINKPSGSVNFAAAATSLVVTNSLVTTSTQIQCTIQTNDATMKSVQCVPASGSFTIFAGAAATAETRIYWEVKTIQ